MKRDLYFIQRKLDLAIKIGRSADVEKRLKALVSLHGKVELLLMQPNAGEADSPDPRGGIRAVIPGKGNY